MKFSVTAAVFALAGMAAASPIDMEPRQANASTNVVSGLYTEIQGYTKVINSTMAGINSGSTAEQNQTAQATVTDQTNKIVAALNAGKTTAAKIKARGECSCESDEDQQQIVDDSCNLVYELTWTYQGVTDVWGDSYCGGLLSQVFGALFGVLQSLEGIVDGLLVLVGKVVVGVLGTVGGILGGLFQFLFGWQVRIVSIY